MENIVDITLDNFQQVIIEGSQQKLIMVDFWAEGNEPCMGLLPVLEKLAAEFVNELVLAKVNCAHDQQIAAQFGVRSLPTVMLVKDGQPIDGFAGVQSEEEIRQLLLKHLPKPEDGMLAQAVELLSAGDANGAYTLAKQAYDIDSTRLDGKLILADVYVSLGRVAQARELMETIGLADQDSAYQVLMGKIELAEEAADSPELKALQQELESDPENLELKVKLGVQLQQANRAEEALELLLSVLRKDLNFGEAKKLYLDTINALPDGDPLASSYRRKIYSLLY